MTAATPAKKAGGFGLAVVYVTCLFFIWALVTNLLDPLLKTFKTVFTLTPVEASLTGFAFFIAYGIMSLPSAAFLSKIGYAKSVMVGLGGIVAGCFIAIAAAKLHTFGVFLVGLFVMASGVTLLQVAANPLIASMGKPGGILVPPEPVASLQLAGRGLRPVVRRQLPAEGRHLQEGRGGHRRPA
jgi:FHS family L-fucose permease-like MFS transporter